MSIQKVGKVEIGKSKLEFEKSLELRNFEIDKFWLRGWFFGALLVAIIAGYIELLKGENSYILVQHENSFALFSKAENQNEKYCIYLSFLAFLISAAQCLMNRGSKYWQERWEYHTKHKESALKEELRL